MHILGEHKIIIAIHKDARASCNSSISVYSLVVNITYS